MYFMSWMFHLNQLYFKKILLSLYYLIITRFSKLLFRKTRNDYLNI